MFLEEHYGKNGPSKSSIHRFENEMDSESHNTGKTRADTIKIECEARTGF